MTAKANPAIRVTGGGAERGDQAGKRVNSPYRSETSARKGPSLLFRQLVTLAHLTTVTRNPVIVDGFEHVFGPRPPGKGWWSPIESGPDHHVRSARRRGRL